MRSICSTCQHYEIVDAHNVGTCIRCGQVSKYTLEWERKGRLSPKREVLQEGIMPDPTKLENHEPGATRAEVFAALDKVAKAPKPSQDLATAVRDNMLTAVNVLTKEKRAASPTKKYKHRSVLGHLTDAHQREIEEIGIAAFGKKYGYESDGLSQVKHSHTKWLQRPRIVDLGPVQQREVILDRIILAYCDYLKVEKKTKDDWEAMDHLKGAVQILEAIVNEN